MRSVKCLAFLLLTTSSSLGAEADHDPAAVAKALAPVLDENVIGIIRVDVGRMNVDAIAARFLGFVKATGVGEYDVGVAETRVAKEVLPVRKWVRAFQVAGGRDLYYVLSSTDLLPVAPYVVVPVRPGMKVEDIRKFLTPRLGGPLPFFPQHTEPAMVGNAMVVASPRQLSRLRALKPANRKDLASALAAAGKADMQVLLLPTADSRRVIEEMMPQLPPIGGGGPSRVLTRGIRWAALSIDGPPKMAMRLDVQSQDADAAEALEGYLPKLTDGLITAALASEQGAPDRPRVAPLIRALTPTRTGDRLTLTLDDRQVSNLVQQVLGPVYRNARESARKAEVTKRMWQVYQSVIAYAEEHNSQWPMDLETLVKDGLLDRSLLRDPRRPDLAASIIYLRPTVPIRKAPTDTLILYEAHTAWKGSITVIFVHGHIRLIADRARFKQLLAGAQGQSSTVPGH